MLSILWEIKCKGLKNLNISESPSFDFFSVKSWPVSHSVGNKTKGESQNEVKRNCIVTRTRILHSYPLIRAHIKG